MILVFELAFAGLAAIGLYVVASKVLGSMGFLFDWAEGGIRRWLNRRRYPAKPYNKTVNAAGDLVEFDQTAR